MRSTDTSVAVLSGVEDDQGPLATAAHIATLVSVRTDGTPEVRLGAGPVRPARMATRATRTRLEAASARQQQVIVLLENGEPSQPIIVGFIEPLDAPPDPSPASGAPTVAADVDGKRVEVSAHDEIVLRCGSASITLRRNGRVIIRGTFIDSRSQGLHRIRGGQVQIN